MELSYFLVSRRYTNVVSFFFQWDRECLPSKINADLQSKIRDAKKGDEYSSKLVPKSPYAVQDTFKINIGILWKEEICNKRFAFVCRIRFYFNKL